MGGAPFSLHILPWGTFSRSTSTRARHCYGAWDAWGTRQTHFPALGQAPRGHWFPDIVTSLLCRVFTGGGGGPRCTAGQERSPGEARQAAWRRNSWARGRSRGTQGEGLGAHREGTGGCDGTGCHRGCWTAAGRVTPVSTMVVCCVHDSLMGGWVPFKMANNGKSHLFFSPHSPVSPT